MSEKDEIEVAEAVDDEDDQIPDIVPDDDPVPDAPKDPQWFAKAGVEAIEERVEQVEDAAAKQRKEIRTMRESAKSHKDDVRQLRIRLRDERILEIARGLEAFLDRVQDTHASLQATLDQQSSWRQEAWRLVAIITLVAWILVGAALAVPDLRVAIGRSMLTEREQLMIELVEAAWERDEARRKVVEKGGER